MPEDPNDPVEVFIRQALEQERMANAVAGISRERVEEYLEEVIGRVARHDPTAVGARRYQRARIRKILREAQEIGAEFTQEWEAGIRAELARIGRRSSEQGRALLVASLGEGNEGRVRGDLLTQQQIRSYLNENPFEGALLREHAVQVTEATRRRLREELQRGMVAEESLDDIVRRIRGRRAGRGFTGGVLQTTTRNAEALARTAVADVANHARMETLRRNRSVTKQYQFIATLDTRTTLVCISYDGRRWDYDDPEGRRPPLHFRCRSSTAPVVDWDGLGLAEPEEGGRFARDPETGRRRDVPASTDYGQWLRDAPESKVREVLGRERGDLFLRGEIGVRDLIRGDDTVVPVADLVA